MPGSVRVRARCRGSSERKPGRATSRSRMRRRLVDSTSRTASCRSASHSSSVRGRRSSIPSWVTIVVTASQMLSAAGSMTDSMRSWTEAVGRNEGVEDVESSESVVQATRIAAAKRMRTCLLRCMVRMFRIYMKIERSTMGRFGWQSVGLLMVAGFAGCAQADDEESHATRSLSGSARATSSLRSLATVTRSRSRDPV